LHRLRIIAPSFPDQVYSATELVPPDLRVEAPPITPDYAAHWEPKFFVILLDLPCRLLLLMCGVAGAQRLVILIPQGAGASPVQWHRSISWSQDFLHEECNKIRLSEAN
jgi:hypothetical protein